MSCLAVSSAKQHEGTGATEHPELAVVLVKTARLRQHLTMVPAVSLFEARENAKSIHQALQVM